MLIIKKLHKITRLIGTEVKLRTDLEWMQIGNDSLNKHWESKMKVWEQEKEMLVIWNQELQKEMEAIKRNVLVERERVKIANDSCN